jgi:hypothetical protein
MEQNAPLGQIAPLSVRGQAKGLNHRSRGHRPRYPIHKNFIPCKGIPEFKTHESGEGELLTELDGASALASRFLIRLFCPSGQKSAATRGFYLWLKGKFAKRTQFLLHHPISAHRRESTQVNPLTPKNKPKPNRF